eukprot:GFUD01002174.1.p1 GENE.GFUD01002174.1~~GFUD01002174.1.p1  ORF type:complete len:302 (+),score=61.99 GFUD01002174.1:34-906(+)
MSGFVVPGQQNNPPYSPLQSPAHPPTTGYPPQQSPASYYPSVPHPSQSVYPPQPVPYPVYPPTQDMQSDYIPHQPAHSAHAFSPGSDPQANHYPPPQQAYPYPGQDYKSSLYPPNNETYHCAESNMGLATRATAVADAAEAALASGMKTLLGDKKHKDQNNQAQNDPYHQGQGSPKHDNNGLDDVAQFGQTVLQTGLMGSKGRYAGSAIGVARSDPSKKSGGLLGTAAARGLMGHKGRIAAKAMGMGRPEGQGGISSQSVLGSGLLGSKGSQSRIVAGAAIKLVKGRIQK